MEMIWMNASEIHICVLLLSSFVLLYLLNFVLFNNDMVKNSNGDHSWILRLVANIFSYATIYVPGYLVNRYVKLIDYLDKSVKIGNKDLKGTGYFPTLIRFCFGSNEEHVQNQTTSNAPTYQKSTLHKAVLVILCFTGLQLSYLSWGILQEKVMTQEYVDAEGEKATFKDSQFLVFVNRILAFILAGVIILFTRQPRHRAPLHKYTFCSLSNILSSWCQYEALKYVTFPNQVLAKAGKVIPVMIMGKIISRTKYEYYEYATAIILSLGMVMFMLDTGNDRSGSTVTTTSGFVLLISYVIFDSFTSNWQSALFKTYGVNSIQMMCAVNLFSCLFTATSLIQQGGLSTSINFMYQYPRFVFDCLLLSLCSAVGQLVIFYTIATFGAVVFAIIMTVRQCLAILLSCLIYHHYISWFGIIGVFIVFMAVFLRIYCNHRVKKRKEISPTSLKV